MRISMLLMLLVVCITVLNGCGSSQSQQQKSKKDTASSYIQEIEKGHEADKYHSIDALQFHFSLVDASGGHKISGTFVMTPSMERVRFSDDSSNTVIIWNERSCMVSPDTSSFKKPRFHILTWPYFLAAPYKLGDPGAKLDVKGTKKLNDQEYATALLTFQEGTGDSPDDWYLIYRDRNTNLIYSMAYIVTYSTEAGKAEKHPHAIVYKDHKKFKGIPFPCQWVFRAWDRNAGLGKKLMAARVSDVKEIASADSLFQLTDDARPVPAP